jgi:hypothetical protein
MSDRDWGPVPPDPTPAGDRVALWSRAVSQQDAPAEPIPCPPCRGTGSVISNLGGTASTVACPWCEGTGVHDPEHDAQTQAPGAAGRTSEPDAA